MRSFLFLFMSLFLIGGVSSCKLKPSSYWEVISGEDNGLNKVESFENFNYQLQFIPAEWKEYLQKESTPENIMFFTFKISAEGIDNILNYNLQSQPELQERISYYNSSLKQDFQLWNGGKEMKCVLALFERNYGIGNELVINLAFESNGKLEDLKLHFYDRIYKQVKLNFLIEKEAVEGVPQLKIK